MQKKLIALAVAGLVSGGAFAQSNVTISGQMRVAVDSVRAGGATAANSDYVSRTRITDQNSNIRFAGTEKLSGNLEAWWQVESAIGTDNNTGTAGSNVAGIAGNQTTIGTRNTAIGLRGGFGNFFIGKWDAHYNSMASIEGAGLVDGLALNASSLNLLYTVNGTNTGGGRLNNVMAYMLPSFGNGFTGHVAYTTGSEDMRSGMARKDNGWNLKLGYDNGPFNVSYSYLAVNNSGATPPTAATAAAVACRNNITGAITVAAACPAGTTSLVATTAFAAVAASNGTDTRSNRLGFAYSFPMGLKVGLIWDKSKASNNNSPANTTVATSTDMDRTAWALPISYVTGAHRIGFTYAKANNVKFSGGDDGLSRKATMGMIGYEYSLSKRTSVSATYVQINNDTAGAYDFWHGSSNVGNVSAGGVTAGVDPRMWSFGMKHTF